MHQKEGLIGKFSAGRDIVLRAVDRSSDIALKVVVAGHNTRAEGVQVLLLLVQ